MNLALTVELYCYGTSEGVEKSWDTRGRGSAWSSSENMKSIPGAVDLKTDKQLWRQLDKSTNGPFTMENVEIKGLIPTQSHLNQDAVASYKDQSWQNRQAQHVFVVRRSDGKSYVWQGHHRIAAAALAGQTTVPAHVYRLIDSKSKAGLLK